MKGLKPAPGAGCGDASVGGAARRTQGLVAAAWVLLGLAVCGFGPPTLGSGDPYAPRFGSNDLAAMVGGPVVPAAVRATAAAVMSGADGHMLTARNADAHLAPASLTKMMTALVAVDRFPLNRPIVATERSLTEPVTIGLDPGDTLSLEDMLYGLLLPSGNDAALAIAETVGEGSIDRFVGWMNERALQMGLYNTHFANPTGLDQDGHFSSARDLAEIARAVLAESTLARIVGTPRHVVPGPPLYLFLTSNPLLANYPGVEGVKTGFTDDAGRCFVVSATQDGRRVVVVLLNSPNIAAEGRVLLDAGFELAHPTALQVPRPGFAAVSLDEGTGTGQALTLDLVGWEVPLLRAFQSRSASAISLAGRPLLRW